MARLSPVAAAEARGIVADYYARLFGDADPAALPVPPDGGTASWWTSYAHSPEIFEAATQHFAMFGLLTEKAATSTLDPLLRELAIVRTGYLAASRFVFSQHSKAARRNGVEDAKIAAIRDWTLSDAYTPADRAVLAWTDALVLQQGRATDATFAALKAVLSERDIVELSHHVMTYVGYAAISRALRLAFDDVDDRITEVDPPAA